jgi:hypothetical protein
VAESRQTLRLRAKQLLTAAAERDQQPRQVQHTAAASSKPALPPTLEPAAPPALCCRYDALMLHCVNGLLRAAPYNIDALPVRCFARRPAGHWQPAE